MTSLVRRAAAANAKKIASCAVIPNAVVRTAALAIVLMLPFADARAQSTALARRASRAPIIDGSDADDAWRAATPIGAFRMFDPAEDADPAFATEARITYDASCMYVFVRAFDPQPDSIIAHVSRRDVKTASDRITVLIDPEHDRRAGYEFGVNPAGVKRDSYFDDDGKEDVSWNAVWQVGTRIDSLGWTAEFRIPLGRLRYTSSPSHTFGVMIMRDVARRSERYRAAAPPLDSERLDGLRPASGSSCVPRPAVQP
jgi:cellulose/xylan binding protein with CBM9 domain